MPILQEMLMNNAFTYSFEPAPEIVARDPESVKQAWVIRVNDTDTGDGEGNMPFLGFHVSHQGLVYLVDLTDQESLIIPNTCLPFLRTILEFAEQTYKKIAPGASGEKEE